MATLAVGRKDIAEGVGIPSEGVSLIAPMIIENAVDRAGDGLAIVLRDDVPASWDASLERRRSATEHRTTQQTSSYLDFRDPPTA